MYWPFLHSNHSGSYRPLSPGPFVPANVDFLTATWRPSSQFISCRKTARRKFWLYLWHRSLLCRTVKIRGQTIGVSTYRYLPRHLSNLIVSQATTPQALFSKAVLKPTLLFQSWRVSCQTMPKQSSSSMWFPGFQSREFTICSLEMAATSTNSMQMEWGADSGLLVKSIFYIKSNSPRTWIKSRQQDPPSGNYGRSRRPLLLTRAHIIRKAGALSSPTSRTENAWLRNWIFLFYLCFGSTLPPWISSLLESSVTLWIWSGIICKITCQIC